MITVEDAKQLTHGTTLYHQHLRGTDKHPLRARVSGKCKLWKRSPERFEIPMKHGLYDSGYVTETNKQDWCANEEDAMLHPLRHFGDWCSYSNKTGLRPTKFICNTCKGMKHIPPTGPSPYTINGKYLLCFACGDTEIKNVMKKTGKINLFVRYAKRQDEETYYKEFAATHPGVFPVEKPFLEITGLTSYNVLFRAFFFYEEKRMLHFWFTGPDGLIWYGRHYMTGKGNDNCYCKKTKKSKY